MTLQLITWLPTYPLSNNSFFRRTFFFKNNSQKCFWTLIKKSFEERMTQLNGFTEKDIKTPEVLFIEIK